MQQSYFFKIVNTFYKILFLQYFLFHLLLVKLHIENSDIWDIHSNYIFQFKIVKFIDSKICNKNDCSHQFFESLFRNCCYQILQNIFHRTFSKFYYCLVKFLVLYFIYLKAKVKFHFILSFYLFKLPPLLCYEDNSISK